MIWLEVSMTSKSGRFGVTYVSLSHIQKFWKKETKTEPPFSNLCHPRPILGTQSLTRTFFWPPEEGVLRWRHASHPNHLPVCKAPRVDDPEQNAGTIQASNLEHLLVFKALRREDPEQNAGTIHWWVGRGGGRLTNEGPRKWSCDRCRLMIGLEKNA